MENRSSETGEQVSWRGAIPSELRFSKRGCKHIFTLLPITFLDSIFLESVTYVLSTFVPEELVILVLLVPLPRRRLLVHHSC